MVRAMGKVPVVFKQMVQGYVANRLQAAMGLEVQRMLDEAVPAKDIDDSVIHGIALRMPILGVMAKADFTGLPLMQQGMANRSYTPPEVRGRSETLDRLIAEGRTGVMAGRGYFDWGTAAPKSCSANATASCSHSSAHCGRSDRWREHDQLQSHRQDRAGDRRRVGHRLRHRAHAGEVRRHRGGEPPGR